ncbi:MAG: putative Se/S carrier-like protein [Oscillospiraceae bacterium]
MGKPTIIAVGSITHAMRGQSELAKRGIISDIQRVSHLIPNRGCGYCLKVKQNGPQAVMVLKQAGIRILEVVDEE